MKTELIYFVHGTTYDNASKRCSGWKQVELNELGKEQALNLGKINKDIKFDDNIVNVLNKTTVEILNSKDYVIEF